MLPAGGNTGIGKEIIKELLKHNAKVYMAARSREKALATIEELKKETGKETHYIHLDLTSLASVRKAAEEFLSKEDALHTLFNNACVSPVSLCVWVWRVTGKRVRRGVMWCPVADVTADGYDMQFGTNVVGHFLLTQLLLPALLLLVGWILETRVAGTFAEEGFSVGEVVQEVASPVAIARNLGEIFKDLSLSLRYDLWHHLF